VKKPTMKTDAKPTMERDQGSIKGTGINKKMVKESVPQVVAKNRYGRPSQTQKM
jgi:hypothetical protein